MKASTTSVSACAFRPSGMRITPAITCFSEILPSAMRAIPCCRSNPPSAPYDPETEGDMKAVIDLARDFNVDKGLIIPIPSPRGNIGNVWIGGPDFDDRDTHQPLLYVVALHVFIRLQQLVGRRLHREVHLTHREREVLAWASGGKTAWEIGRILNISHRTVEWHFGQACRKLGATNRSQAVAILGARGELLEQEA